MKSTFKRFMGIILAMLMIVAMVPTTAFADHTTIGSPNAFTIVSDETGKEIDYLLVDTMTQGGQKYYGLMVRKSVHGWAGDDTIKFGDGCNLGWADDEDQESTDTAVYKKLYTYLDENIRPISDIVDVIFPESVTPYIETLEHEICNDTTGAKTFYTVDDVTIPTYEMLGENMDYILLEGIAGDAQSGSLGRGNSAWKDGDDWIRNMQVTGDEGFGQLNVGLNYYWHPLVYVNEEFFANVKIDTTKEIGDNVKDCLKADFSKAQLSDLYTEEELAELGVQEVPADLQMKHSPNYLKLENGVELLYNGTDGDYINFLLTEDLAGRYGTEGFVIANNQYYISSFWTVNSGTSVSDAAMSKLPAEMVDFVQTRGYQVNLAGGNLPATTQLKASIPSHATLDAHAEYIQLLIDDNEGFMAGGTYGAAVGICVAAVNNEHPWNHYAFPGGVVASDGNYFTGSVFAEFYVHKDFLKNMKISTTTIGKNVKNLISKTFVKADFADLDYTAEELDKMGVRSFMEHTKDVGNVANTYEFEINNKKYVVLPEAVEEDDEVYYPVISVAAEDFGYGHIAIDDTDTDRPRNGIKYVNIKYLEAWGSRSYPLNDEDYVDQYFPLDAFGDYIEEREWIFETERHDPNTDEWIENQWMWGTEGPYELRAASMMGIPTIEQYLDALEENENVLNYTAGVLSLVSYPDYEPSIKAGLKTVSPDGIVADRTSRLVTYIDTNSMTFDYIGAPASFCSGVYMVYVHEDFFKNTSINLETVGSKFKNFIKNNYSPEDLTGWSSVDIQSIFGGYNGEGMGIDAYVDETGANVVIHNNSDVADGNGAVIIVAAYKGKALADIKFLTLDRNVSASSYTDPFNFNMSVDGADVTYKAMVWDSFTNCKPIVSAVEF